MTESIDQPDDRRSRRAFLGAAIASLAGPAALISCRRSKSDAGSSAGGAAAAGGPALPHNLDDVGETATFRPPLPTIEPVVRVRVMRVRETRSQRAQPLVIGTEGQWLMLHGRGEAESAALAPADAAPAPGGLAMQGPVRVAMSASGWSITDSKGFRAAVAPRETIDIVGLEDEADPVIAVAEHERPRDARQYRGRLRLVSRHDLVELNGDARATLWGFDVVNCISIEHYLPGVLAGELYAHWRLETFAAQAVAARSFAATEVAVFAGRRHFDLSNSAASQMYVGVVAPDGVHAKAHQAVEATRGILLAYEQLLVSGYYSSCCGGVAASAVDAIGSNAVNNIPPLLGRSGSDVCTGAPVYAWTIEQPLEQLARRIGGYARDRSISEFESIASEGPITAIDVAAVNPHGRPTRMAVATARGVKAEISAESFRRAANFASPDGSIRPPEKELRSSNVRATIGRSAATFDGRGFGHGVGLCQFGAEALAQAGQAHADILRWYYPDVQIARTYG